MAHEAREITYRIISSNVLLSREDSASIAQAGGDASIAVQERLQSSSDRKVNIEVIDVYDADIHSLCWAGSVRTTAAK